MQNEIQAFITSLCILYNLLNVQFPFFERLLMYDSTYHSKCKCRQHIVCPIICFCSLFKKNCFFFYCINCQNLKIPIYNSLHFSYTVPKIYLNRLRPQQNVINGHASTELSISFEMCKNKKIQITINNTSIVAKLGYVWYSYYWLDSPFKNALQNINLLSQRSGALNYLA